MDPVTSRDRVALAEPPEDLNGFPVAEASGVWFRAHAVNRGPWWFAHGGEGRFDLDPPHGTCYLGSHVEVAVRERLGENLVAAGMIPADEADRMVVSTAQLDGLPAADATDQKASSFGVTRELSTLTPYDLPRRWATALHAQGMDALRYWPRFCLAAEMRALAMFGTAGGDQALSPDPAPMCGREAAEEAGIAVVEVPHSLPTVLPPSG